MSNTDEQPAPAEQQWGRVLICGGTDWPKLGRKDRGGAAKEEKEPPLNPDLLEPHILRSLGNVKAVSVHTSCCGCHFVVLDIDGTAWLFGRNGSSALGVSGEEYISENAPRAVKPTDLGAPKGTKFVHAACGRNHTLLVGSDGGLWTAGANNLGQCGHNACPEISTFKAVNVSHGGNKEHAIQASAGITFSIVLTESGKVFSFGSAEKGQLGNGTTGERIITGNKTGYDVESSPIYIKELDGKKIVQIVSGPQHSLALDDAGLVYVWGYNGYCRLGLGNQVDALKPKVVPQFAGPNEATMGAYIAAGPSCSAVVDKQGMYYMTGKWKNSGEGSSGSPYSVFRFMHDVMGCKVTLARSGGVTHWFTAPEDDGSVMTVCWGQNAANGELGLGPEEAKSATKPIRNVPLTGINVIDIAAGQNTTTLIAKPNEKFADLPRHPIDVNPPPACVKCSKDEGDPLECDKCDSQYHLACLDPPLDAVPDGEWFCPDCLDDPGAPVGAWTLPKKKGKAKTKRAATPSLEETSTDAGSKRKAPASKGKAGAASKKKKQ
ncbi:regulator of chromosome condensation 1/beta-lactamase-inhibitor protein II [Crucibulum laeve]|uniref:Regulator of chromosome condensation 1/beta-lactamase-inhibitor protein II n=1 Tax=Crucibulum laeve TaxID=68775 RepID=A0A5C3LZH0_9AGAR|nr:regulator of chromosome condensation 1/beta-lactamase-inhibitor protein II [Crucibulum laeve]